MEIATVVKPAYLAITANSTASSPHLKPGDVPVSQDTGRREQSGAGEADRGGLGHRGAELGRSWTGPAVPDTAIRHVAGSVRGAPPDQLVTTDGGHSRAEVDCPGIYVCPLSG
jgi:hypothetical protein